MKNPTFQKREFAEKLKIGEFLEKETKEGNIVIHTPSCTSYKKIERDGKIILEFIGLD